MTLTVEDLVNLAMSNPINAEIYSRLPSLRLNQCMLTAGCLFQAVWNNRSNLPSTWGVKDYDVFYFDSDLSWEAENEVILEAAAIFHDLPVNIEIKNQARVHLWYEAKFSRAYAPLLSAKEGIDRYLIAGTCVGLGAETGEVYAPNGLNDIDQGLLRINPKAPQPGLFERKAESYQTRWPWLEIIEY
ncbi:nucleotidyltransferase family protein [Pseudomonas sp. NPDC078700]|uniref:nucleotidyltransferase family protein n=1 Tax=Pseudomonas sp. NPDC078700 TaxID=3364424 RepID=UPI0037C6CA99